MLRDNTVTRRQFIQVAAAAGAAATLPLKMLPSFPLVRSARYRRYSVASPEGQKALSSYAKGVEAMLKLPLDDPRNWFRSAFVHLMDCPHGNWWFYVWHRGYLGYVEQTIRKLSGDPDFALPYWDWTSAPQFPDRMFDGVLNPGDAAFEPYIRNLEVFTSNLLPVLTKYFNAMTFAQVSQLHIRKYGTVEAIWDNVTGHDSSLPNQPDGRTSNVAYANPSGARYLTRDNSKLDEKTSYDVSPFIIRSGLTPTKFFDQDVGESFTGLKTPSHSTPAGDKTAFSILEGMPHNKVHNYIGGVGPLNPGPWGYMTNFLSPVDPIFFLHHANMDRLWDIWTRKQKAMGLPYLPTGDDLSLFSKEPLLFFFDAEGNYVTNGSAADYMDTSQFDYDYSAGFGEDVVNTHPVEVATRLGALRRIPATIRASTASVELRTDETDDATGRQLPLVAVISLQPIGRSWTSREFDVFVGDGPNRIFAGTLAFFGHMMSTEGATATIRFAVPLPNIARRSGPLSIHVSASHDARASVTLRSVTILQR